MNTEILEVKKEEEKKEIENLNACCEKLEILREQMPVNSLSFERLNAFIKELEKEIGYSEVIIQELNDSIDFEESKKE